MHMMTFKTNTQLYTNAEVTYFEIVCENCLFSQLRILTFESIVPMLSVVDCKIHVP